MGDTLSITILPNMNLVADSLGWAVLHSLWQGVLAAGLLVLLRKVIKDRAADARYFAGFTILCALLCAFVGTFLYYYNVGANTIGAVQGGMAQTVTLNGAQSGADASSPLSANPLLYLTNYTMWIGVVWAGCCAVLGVRYLSAFRQTHNLRTNGITALSTEWQNRFDALVQTSGVTPKVRAFLSQHVSSPITFGFFKPVVLVPTWFFTGMTPAQCDTIMMVGTQHFAASAVAGCQPYFQALADSASVAGTFQTVMPRVNGAQVIVSTSGSGG